MNTAEHAAVLVMKQAAQVLEPLAPDLAAALTKAAADLQSAAEPADFSSPKRIHTTHALMLAYSPPLAQFRTPGLYRKADAIEDLLRTGLTSAQITATATASPHSDFYDMIHQLRRMAPKPDYDSRLRQLNQEKP